jgi:hypothetical protein
MSKITTLFDDHPVAAVPTANALAAWGSLFRAFTDGSRPIHLMAPVYHLIWAAGLVGAFISYVQLQMKGSLGLRVGWSVTIGAASFLQQYFVYRDVHALEGQGQDDYKGWANHPVEKVLRLAIVLALLFGVGELGAAVLPLLKLLGLATAEVAKSETTTQGGNALHSEVFVVGSIFVYAFTALWNVGSLFLRESGVFPEKSDPKMWPHLLVSIRNFLFTLVSSVAVVFWWFVLYSSPSVASEVAEALTAVYVLLAIVMLLTRLEKVKQAYS